MLSPGAEVTVKHYGQQRTLAVGTLLHCPENSKSLYSGLRKYFVNDNVYHCIQE